MRTTTRIALRYLHAARRERHVAFLSTISILGLAIGVAALLFSVALLSGLQENIKSRLIAGSPHLLIEPVGSNTIADWRAIVDTAKPLGMSNAQPIVSGIGWAANQDEERGRPVRIRSAAIDLPPDSIALSRGTAASLGLTTGDAITIVVPRTRLTPFGPAPVWRKYRVAKLTEAAEDERAADANLTLPEAEALFGTDGKPTSIEMTGSVERAEEIQSALQKRFPDVQVKTWKEINRPMFLALRLEKTVMFATISLVIFVAALNLISSLAMLIMEKRPSVGVLRTLGATEANIRSVFMQVGLFIGVTGTLLGNLLGVGGSWGLNRYHIVRLPHDITFLNYLPFSLEAQDVIIVNVIALALSVIATWYPARVAAKLDPINAIREEA